MTILPRIGIEFGLCGCGCGERTAISVQNHTRYGYIKGQPLRFRAGHHKRLLPAKSYRTKKVPSHPKATESGCIAAHILIAEAALGYYMPEKAEVHHVDGNKQNNINRNLVICQNRAYHKLLHARTRILRAGGDPDTQRICSMCRAVKTIDKFHHNTKKALGVTNRCTKCSVEYGRARWRRIVLSRTQTVPREFKVDPNGVPIGHYAARDQAAKALMDWVNMLPDSIYRLGLDDSEAVSNIMLAVYLEGLRTEQRGLNASHAAATD